MTLVLFYTSFLSFFASGLPWASTFEPLQSGDSVLQYEVLADCRVVEVDYGERTARPILTPDKAALDPAAIFGGYVGLHGRPSLFFLQSTDGFDPVFVADPKSGSILKTEFALNVLGDSACIPLADAGFLFSHIASPSQPELASGLYVYDTGEVVSLPKTLELLHAKHVYGKDGGCVYIIKGFPEPNVQRVRFANGSLIVDAVQLPEMSLAVDRSVNSFVDGENGVALFSAYNRGSHERKYFVVDLEKEVLVSSSQLIDAKGAKAILSQSIDETMYVSLIGTDTTNGNQHETGIFVEHQVDSGNDDWSVSRRINYAPEQQIALLGKSGQLELLPRCRFDMVNMDALSRAATKQIEIESWDQRESLIQLLDDAIHDREIHPKNRWKVDWILQESMDGCGLKLVDE